MLQVFKRVKALQAHAAELVLLYRSNVPTAFTGYSFHVVEAAIVFANEILVCFLFPIHIGVHRVYHLFTTVIHNGE